jgi:molybdopterin converting factor subunit 1
MKILYFAWLKSKIGADEEEVSPPAGVSTVSALIDWLVARGPRFADAFEHREVIHVAINQRYAHPGDPVGPDDEVAFFPPIAGG